MGAESWIIAIGGLLAVGVSVWYYASLGKKVSLEEKQVDKDLTYELNPFTGSARGTSTKK